MSDHSVVDLSAIDLGADSDSFGSEGFHDDDADSIAMFDQEEEEQAVEEPSPYYPGIDVCIVRPMR